MKRLVLALALAACGNSYVDPSSPTSASSTKGYPVPDPVGAIVTDAAAFNAFATAVKPDLEREAASKDPEVASNRLFLLATLEALDGHWDQAVALLDKAAALAPTPEDKVMVGLTLRVWADAQAAGGTSAAFRDALDARVAKLPLDKLGEPLAMLRTMGQQFSPAVCAQLVTAEVSPHIANKQVTIEQAHPIIFQRYAVVRLAPVGRVIDEVLGSHGIAAVGP